jgi:protein-L-isoaspartate(D-aspartate) O-methyltransferase
MWTLCLLGALVTAQDFAREREQMVRLQIERRGVKDAAALRAMREVPRHLYVPGEVRAQAYEDHPLRIGRDATISQPYIVALMTELLRVERRHRVLEIGTGSGYQAAVLARLASHVYSVELVPELAAQARQTLEDQSVRNVTVRQGDGYQGWAEHAPYDRIMVTAAPPEIPEALLKQLAPGGRLVAPVGRGFDQELVLVEKSADGRLTRSKHGAVIFVPLRPGL